jgi:hypothetical protein
MDMVSFGETIERNLSVKFTREDKNGYKVAGSASYNKDNALTGAYGTISNGEGVFLGTFSVHGSGDNARMQCDCALKVFAEVQGVALATFADLADDCPVR